ncbi:MAG: single-stranded DNA-binding protein [Deltaproteobacteria bacterium]|nr:single-stranded DNA-binding protein [Deltaproteobacteria bacterium]
MAVTDTLASSVNALSFAPPVTYVYNPLVYARDAHAKYVKKYARSNVVLWVGMNPGPFGMAQTGVPFGDVTMVRDFLRIKGKLANLPLQHPKRPIEGFDCPRSEVSGTRLWGYAKDQFLTPAAFFKQFYVVNYCPLVFMGETGKNITPDKLPGAEREALFKYCDLALRKVAQAINARFALGVGAFAKGACERALNGLDIPVGQILHPSPASPAANRGWAEAAHKQLKKLELV